MKILSGIGPKTRKVKNERVPGRNFHVSESRLFAFLKQQAKHSLYDFSKSAIDIEDYFMIEDVNCK